MQIHITSFRRTIVEYKSGAKCSRVSFFDSWVDMGNRQTLVHDLRLLSANAEVRANFTFLLDLFLLILNNVANLLFSLQAIHLKLVYFFS